LSSVEVTSAEVRRRRAQRLLALARPEWRTLALGTVFLLIGSGMNLAFPQAIRVIMDQALEQGNVRDIDLAALVMVGIFAVQAVAQGLRYYVFTVAGERVVTRLREELYARIVAQEIGFFDGERTGELLSRLSADTGVLQNAVSVNISMALRHAAGVIGGLALLFWISPQLTLLMLVVVPPVAVGAAMFGRRIRRLSALSQERLADAGKVAEETLAGIRTVRSFAQEQAEVARYGRAVQASFDVSKERVASVALFSGVASLLGYGAVAAVLWYGGRLVVASEMTAGELTSFILYTLMVAFALGSLASLWTDFMRALGSAERVFDLMDRVPGIDNQGGRRLSAVAGRLAFEGVRFAYPTRPDVTVLKGLELTIEPGEVVALVGPSGSGKSTVAALISRFYDPQEGRVTVDGEDVRGLDPEWLRRQIGVVSQEPTLLSTSVAENIRYGKSDATDAEVEAAARAANAHDFITGFPEGYATQVGERGVQLSGGQKQRVAIARAILKNPRLLILDEATSALDAQSEHLVQEALEHLQAGRTTLVIAHRLSTVRDADRVVVMEAGEVRQVGSHDALMAEQGSLYRRLVERQFASA
jgi:ABC transporter fused permease/ATP-binding protein